MEIFHDRVIWTLFDKQEIILSARLWIDDIHPLDVSDSKLKIQVEFKFRLVIISFYFLPIPAYITAIPLQLPLLHADFI